MESMLMWGLDFIRSVQTFANPALTVVMRIITNLGGAQFYFVIFTIIYLCIDEKKGLRLSMVFAITLWINLCLKFLLNQPRPFFEGYDPSVGMVAEKMGGLPSGHAQISLVVFFIIAEWFKRKRAFFCAALFTFLIGFSRIYLGVHFPTDVFGGWILGGVILCGYFLFSDKIEALLIRGGFRAGMMASAILSFMMILYLPNEALLLPGGVLFGMGAGYCLNRRYVGFNAEITDKTGAPKYLNLLVRFLLGITGLVLILAATGKIIPQNSANKSLYWFLCFAIGGLWLCAGAPWVFVKLRMANGQITR